VTHPVPAACLDHHIAVLAKTGAGKSYAVQGIVEWLLERGDRVCVIDPTGRWWGLRSNAAGDGPGFPVVVFGGAHADVPLGAAHGDAIADIVGTTNTPAILDTRLMTVGERTRFFADFAESLLRKNKSPLTLVIDEAHLFAPQGRVSDPQSGKMLHAANNLVSLGRGIGLRIILISQRPAKLHKDSLTQVETLIALRLIHNLDSGAVEAWIGEWGTEKEGRDVMKSLASLPTGTGWIWSPEIGVLKQVRFPPIKTFDSGRAPSGDTGDGPVFAPIDLKAIQTRLETATASAVEDDPKFLRKRIAELQRQTSSAGIDDAALDAAHQDGYRRGKIDGYAEVLAAIGDLAGTARRAHAALSELVTELDRADDWANRSRSELEDRLDRNGATIEPATKPVPTPAATAPAPVAPRPRPADAAEATGGKLGAAHRAFLTALAQRGRPLTRNQVAIFAGYSVKSRHVDNTLASLRSAGHVEGGREALSITGAGRAALGRYEPLPTGVALQRYWLGQLGAAERAFLENLIHRYPRAVSRDDLASATGYSPASRHVDNTLARLRSLELATGPRQAIRAADDLMGGAG